MNAFRWLVKVVVVSGMSIGVAMAGGYYAVGKRLVQDIETAIESRSSVEVAAGGSLEVAFSPNEGSEALVVKVIDASRQEIRMLTYSFTSAPVTRALLNAKHRGVNVHVVVDFDSNVLLEKSGKWKSPKSIAALGALVNAGVDVRTIKAYQIHHDKVIIVDGRHVELGSFNYSDAAANRNSENVLVNWNNPQLAKVYIDHFNRNYGKAVVYQGNY